MRNWPGVFAGITKPDLKAAVDATDDWIEANSTSFNTALPQPFRSNASAPQKTFLLCYVAYHFTTVETKYGGEGWMRGTYFFLLITHIVLAGERLTSIRH